MAFIKLHRKRLAKNYQHLKDFFQKNQIEWGVVTKLLCGNENYIQEIINLGVKEIHDSRISNLKKVKELAPNIQTVYIKPPAKRSISSIIKYADVSMNTEFSTIKMLSEEAIKQNKKHKIVIMVELGDLREGVMGDELIDFYGSIFKLKNIEVTALGANLNCLNGVMPSQDKLAQLCLYKKIIELQFKRKIPFVSGGSSVNIPLLLRKQMPKGVNHLRIGETLYFGVNLFKKKTITGMHSNVFELSAEIIELTKKPVVPFGELEENPSGEKFKLDESKYGEKAHRAIIDIGLLDVNPEFLIPKDDNLNIIGASSDMLVIELGQSYNRYKIGDTINFHLKYMGALSIMNSKYIDKIII